MIDNFGNISDLILRKATGDEFYFLQIIKRRKDNPGMEKDMFLIDNFFILGADDLIKKKNRIIELCISNNARAYFRLNKRSKKKVALQTLKLVAENIAAENYDIKNCYLSACGQYHSDPDKTWVIDIDDIDYKDMNKEEIIIKQNEMFSFIQTLIYETGKDDIMSFIQTKNGYHGICRPFNLQKFREKYPNISIHKDNPTILYIP